MIPSIDPKNEVKKSVNFIGLMETFSTTFKVLSIMWGGVLAIGTFGEVLLGPNLYSTGVSILLIIYGLMNCVPNSFIVKKIWRTRLFMIVYSLPVIGVIMGVSINRFWNFKILVLTILISTSMLSLVLYILHNRIIISKEGYLKEPLNNDSIIFQ